jgi:hypothetical protein
MRVPDVLADIDKACASASGLQRIEHPVLKISLRDHCAMPPSNDKAETESLRAILARVSCAISWCPT